MYFRQTTGDGNARKRSAESSLRDEAAGIRCSRSATLLYTTLSDDTSTGEPSARLSHSNHLHHLPSADHSNLHRAWISLSPLWSG